MKISSRALELAQSAGLILVIATGTACTANMGDAEALDQATSDLKGGIPANDHGKGRNKGEAGSVAGVDEDAGVDERPGKKAKKPKKDKADKPQGNSGRPPAGDAEEDVDEAADETEDSDDGTDETV